MNARVWHAKAWVAWVRAHVGAFAQVCTRFSVRACACELRAWVPCGDERKGGHEIELVVDAR